MILHPIQIAGGVVGEYSFGSCSYDASSWELNDVEENVWRSISPPSAVSEHLHDVTHDGFGKLTIIKPGKYYISWLLDLPGEEGEGLGYGQFSGDEAGDCIETAVKVNGELITQNQDNWSLNEIIANWCVVDVGAEDIVDVNIRAIIPTISTIIMGNMNLGVVEIIPGLQHHFPSLFI